MQFDGGGDTLPANPPKTIAPSPLAAQESGAIGAASMASQYKEPGKGAGMKMGSAKAPVDKSGYDRSIKVSQATVDAVKKDGAKSAANKVAYGSPGYVGSTMSPNAPVSPEYKEAAKRVYPNAKATSPAASSGATNPKQPGPKAAAPKASAPKASAFPPILPAPSKPKATSKPNSAAALPPLMTPPTPKASAPAKVKVSQATVDAVKSQGKAKAISNAKSNVSNAEYKEAVRRVYQSPAKPKAKSGGGGGRTSSAVK
jgi:carnitine O-acetyltransferase